MQLEEAVEEFLLAKWAEGMSPLTIKWYKTHFKRLLRFLGKTMSVGDITLKDLRRFAAHLHEQSSTYRTHSIRPEEEGGFSIWTMCGSIQALRTFFKWLAEEEIIKGNPAARLKQIKPPRPEPKAVSPEDFALLIRAAEDNLRDYALLLFLADTGCRVGELTSLRVQDLNLDEEIAFVRGKGHKLREVLFTKPTAEALRRWLKARPKDKGDAVFVGKRGPLTPSGIYQVLKRLKKRAGVSGPCNPHAFRHGFARHYILTDGDMLSLSIILGHSSSEVTREFYAVFLPRELKEKHHKHSPVVDALRREED
jgi:site-specific recombinase XerD